MCIDFYGSITIFFWSSLSWTIPDSSIDLVLPSCADHWMSVSLLLAFMLWKLLSPTCNFSFFLETGFLLSSGLFGFLLVSYTITDLSFDPNLLPYADSWVSLYFSGDIVWFLLSSGFLFVLFDVSCTSFAFWLLLL